MPRDWDAATYDRVSAPIRRRALAALRRLRLGGRERVLDAGCGSGRVTAEIVAQVPDGSVVGADASPSMIALARDVLGGAVELHVADLRRPLPLAEPVDAVLSTNVLHWVDDHAAALASIAAVMRPGARLVIDAGGTGNIARVVEILERMGEDVHPWNFAAPAPTRALAEAAGLVDVAAWLSRDPILLAPEDLRPYAEAILLGAHLEGLPADEREAFVDEFLRRLGRPEIDYVRLNVMARRGPER